MARVFIDCSYIDFGRQPTGIPRVVLKYIEEGYIWAEQTGHELIPVVPTSNGVWLCRPVPGDGAPAELIARANASENTSTKQPPHLFVPSEDDVLFAPSYWHDNDPQLYRDIKASGCQVVILVHDILPIAYKQFYESPWRYRFAAAVVQALGYADRLACVSNVTRNAIEAFAAERGLTPPPIEVAYNGHEPLVSGPIARRIRDGRLAPHTGDAVARQALGLDAPLLMVGSIEPKKGHIPVIRCLEAMWATGYARPLVVVGRPGWMEKDIVTFITNSPYHGSKLFWLSGLDDHDLAYAYLRSHALIFASIAEGFGLPMIEAAMLDRPVVVLDTPIAREVLGEHGVRFDEAGALMRALLRLEDATEYAVECARAATFEWPNWAQLVPALMDELVAGTIKQSGMTQLAQQES